MGLTYFKQGKTSQAEAEWRNTIIADPKHPRALYNLANLYAQAGRVDDAGQMYCRFAGAAGDQYPSEKLTATGFIKTQKVKCRD